MYFAKNRVSNSVNLQFLIKSAVSSIFSCFVSFDVTYFSSYLYIFQLSSIPLICFLPWPLKIVINFGNAYHKSLIKSISVHFIENH